MLRDDGPRLRPHLDAGQHAGSLLPGPAGLPHLRARRGCPQGSSRLEVQRRLHQDGLPGRYSGPRQLRRHELQLRPLGLRVLHRQWV